ARQPARGARRPGTAGRTARLPATPATHRERNMDASSATRMKSRSQLREERHPNAVTAPPLNRGSMVPRPWRGFWNSIGTALLSGASRVLPPYGHSGSSSAWAARAAEPLEPWQKAANRRRAVFIALTLAWTMVAGLMFLHLQPDGGNPVLSVAQLLLFVALSAWVLTGFVTALMGFWV